MDGLVGVWDAKPLITNSSGKKLKGGKSSDPEAGWIIKRKYVVGYGYEEVTLVDLKRGLPLDYYVYPRDWNDYMKFEDSSQRFLKKAAVIPREFHTDAGPDSHKINRAIQNAG